MSDSREKSIPLANLEAGKPSREPERGRAPSVASSVRTMSLADVLDPQAVSTASMSSMRSARAARTNMYETLANESLYDSLAPQFHVSVFLRQLVSHLVLPLLFLVPNPRAQGLRLDLWYLFDGSIINPLMCYGMLAAFFLSSYHDQSVLGYSVFIPALFFLVHRTTVSLKYATLSPTEYARFNACRDDERIASYIQQMQLLSGWRTLDEALMLFELSAASSRIGVKINEIFVRINGNLQDPVAMSQFRYWNAFLRGHELIAEDAPPAREFLKLPNGDYGVSVFDLCVAVMRRANHTDDITRTSIIGVHVIALLLLAILIVPPVLRFDEIESPVRVIIYLALAGRILWIYARAFFFFLYVALIDVDRYGEMLRSLHCMVRLSDLMMHAELSLVQCPAQDAEAQAKDRLEAIISIAKSHYDNTATLDACSSIIAEEDSDNGERASTVIGEKLARHGMLALLPRMNLEYAENSAAWIYARLAIQNFGERFRYRTDMYIAFTMLLMVVMMSLSLLSVIDAAQRNAAFGSVLFLEAITTISLFLVMMVLITVFGSSVNLELCSQSRTLIAHAAKIKTKVLNLRATCTENDASRRRCERLQDALESISEIVKVAEINNTLKPYKVLGMVAQSTLTMSILTSAVSFYSIIFSLYSASNASPTTVSY